MLETRADAIDKLTPADKLNGLGPMILEQRDHKLEEARARRAAARREAHEVQQEVA